MGKAIKKYVAWTLSLVIMSFVMTGSVTLQAAPTYELKGNDRIRKHYEQLLVQPHSHFSRDTGEYSYVPEDDPYRVLTLEK